MSGPLAAVTDVMISRQALVNCVPSFVPGNGCKGGDERDIYEYMSHTPVPDETCQPYEARNNTCTPYNTCRNCFLKRG